MVLFTMLGLYALFQRERGKVNNTHSGHNENVDQSDEDLPPLEIDEDLPPVETDEDLPPMETDEDLPSVETDEDLPSVETDEDRPPVETDEGLSLEDNDEDRPPVETDEGLSLEDNDEDRPPVETDEGLSLEDNDEDRPPVETDEGLSLEDNDEGLPTVETDEDRPPVETDEGLSLEENDEDLPSVETNEDLPSVENDEGLSLEDNDEDLPPVETDEGLSLEDNDEGLSLEDNDEDLSLEENDEDLPSVENDEGLSLEDNDEGLSLEDNDEGLPSVENDEGLPSVENDEDRPPVETDEGLSLEENDEDLPSVETDEGLSLEENDDGLPPVQSDEGLPPVQSDEDKQDVHVMRISNSDFPDDHLCFSLPEDTAAPQLSQQKDDNRKIIAISSCSYEIGIQLGEGGFGTVHAATRLEDGLQVAVKFASKKRTTYLRVDNYSKPIPMEIALQMRADQEPRVPQILQLLDWEDKADQYIMVLERPMPCQSLDDFLENYTGTIDENLTRVIMRQVTFAAQTCCQRGVFHRDIKMENLLINPGTLEVKLIDFGCGDELIPSGYTSFVGTEKFCPPEYWINDIYHGEPTTVWSLGILLFLMLCEDFPKIQDLVKIIKENNWTKDGLSQECCDFICCCLQFDPELRIELDKVSLHNWFKIDDVKNNNGTIVDQSGTISLRF